MIINRKFISDYSLSAIICMLLMYYLPINLSFVLILMIVVLMLFKNDLKISNLMPGISFYAILFLIALLVGVRNLSVGSYSNYVYIKHVIYLLNTILYWSAGKILIKHYVGDRSRILNSLVFVSAIVVILDLINVLTMLDGLSFVSIEKFRGTIGHGTFFALIGIYVLLFYYKEVKMGKLKKIFIVGLCIISIVIHMSRRFLMDLVILIIFSGISFNLKKIGKILLILIGVAFSAYLIFPDIFIEFANKLLRSITELSSSNVTWNSVEITRNWRGYEVYMAKDQFSKLDFFHQIFGTGFGTALDVGEYVKLVSNEEKLSFLHNGYYTILLIGGIFGVILYIIWEISFYRKAALVSNRQDKMFIKGLALCMVFDTYVVNGPFFNNGVCIYIFIISMFYTLNFVSPVNLNKPKSY